MIPFVDLVRRFGDIDLEDFIAFHKNSGGLATMALASVDDVTGLGVASLKGSKIIGFMKPTKENAPSNLINAGMIILEPKVLNIQIRK